MKRIPARPVPPRPISRSDPQEKIEVQTLSTFYGIIYSYNTESKWQAILPDYIKIDLLDYGGDLASRYKLLAVQSGGQNLLEYTLTSSTRANVKGNFVKLHDEQLTHGMRFTKPSIAQEFSDQVVAVVSDLSPYSRINTTKSPDNITVDGVPIQEFMRTASGSTVRTSSSASSNSNHTGNSDIPPKVPGVKITLHLIDKESRQLTLEKTTQIGDFLDRICKEEKLVSSFYIFHYVTPSKTPVPLACKVGDLDSYELRLVDKRDRQKSSSLENQKAQKDKKNAKRFSLFSTRTNKEEKLQTPAKIEKEYALDVADPLVRSFLDVANIHDYELKKPQVRRIIEEFIAKRGGVIYLKQIRDSKPTPQVLDEINQISQRITALCDSPTKAASQYHRGMSTPATSDKHYDLRRAKSVDVLSPSRDAMTMQNQDSVQKRKRRAPLPPGQVRALVHAESLTSINSKEEEDGYAVPADIMKPKQGSKRESKRKAPLPPGEKIPGHKSLSPTASLLSTSSGGSIPESTPPSPYQQPYQQVVNSLKSLDATQHLSRKISTSSSNSSDQQEPKAPPTFNAPPPPDGPPPEEMLSPVGPLSSVTPNSDRSFSFSGGIGNGTEVKKSLENELADQKSPEGKRSPRETTINGTIVNSQPATNIVPMKEDVASESFIGNVSGNSEEKINGSTMVRPVEDKSDDVENEEGSSEIEGYTVKLLENQMKTILSSIKLLDEVKDEGKKETMLKPLLLQQTILQKMIDQEKQNQTQITKIVASPKKGEKAERDLANGGSEVDLPENREIGVKEHKDRGAVVHEDVIVTAEQCVELEAVHVDFDERLSPTNSLQGTEKQRKKLAVNLDLTGDDVLIADNARTEAENDILKGDEEIDRLKKADEENAARKAREEEERRRIEVEKQEREEKQKTEDAKREQKEKRQMEAEKRRILEELRRMEEERQRRMREEKERMKEEKRKIIEEARKKEEQMKREIEEKRLIEEQAKRKMEEKRKIEEEAKRKMEEEAKREREEEEARKMAEQTEIELLRKELEKREKQENERLEKERKEIEDLKKMLKEQQELQEKENLEREQREKEEYKKFMDEMKTSEIQEEKKLFRIMKGISFDDDEGNIVEIIEVEKNKEKEDKKGVIEYQEAMKDTLPEVVNDSQPEKMLKVLPDVVNNNSLNTEVVKEIETKSRTIEPVKSPVPAPITVDKDQTSSGKDVGPQIAMKPNPAFVPPRRPSANFVSSASRSSDTETTKKPLLGLYAKIQEMANSRASTTSNSTSTVSTSAPLPSMKPQLTEAAKAAPTRSTNEAGRPSATMTSVNDGTIVAPKPTAFGRQPQVTASSASQPPSQSPASPIRSQIPDAKANLPVATAPLTSSNAPMSGIIAEKPATDLNVVEIKPKENVTSSKTLEDKKDKSGTSVVSQQNGPFTNMMPVSFKPQGFRPTSSFLAKLSEKSQESSKISPNQGPVASGENKVSGKDEKTQGLTTGIPNEIKKENSVTSQTENKSANAPSRNSAPDIFSSRQTFLPDVYGNDFQIKTDPKAESDIGNYRPKCLSPDDFRSTFDSGSAPSKSVTSSFSSAAILKNTIEKKAPSKTLPKTAPKTLPKTLPKPAGKQKQTTEEPNKRASVKDKINNFDLPQKGTNEKRKEYLNLAAIPNRSAEISSGNISSNIMNKPIVHEEKKERSNSKVGDSGRKLPTTPGDSSNTGHLGSTNADKDISNQLQSGSVTTESVQAPSLLRRLSLNSLQNETSPTNATPRDVTPRETAPVLKESPEETEGPTPLDNNANNEPVKLGNYASVREVNKNENAGRDTVTVKKVGGLKIGFGRDKPKVYHS